MKKVSRTQATSFWSRVEPTGFCWYWRGSVNRNGYGQFSRRVEPGVGGKTVTASTHRLSYELLVGPIPDGLHIDHLCGNRLCVNPDHLEPVTKRLNDQRRSWRRRSQSQRA